MPVMWPILTKVVYGSPATYNGCMWIHALTFYQIDARGQDGMRTGILPLFKAAVHDHWASYLAFTTAARFCNAHHL
ncbi:MAG: hypothetical protein R3A44_01775 [Caldilineaceae bacterium]